MTQEQVGIVLELLKRNVRSGSVHEPRFHEFHVLNEDADGVVRRFAVKERERTVVLYGSDCAKVRARLDARRNELEQPGWSFTVPSLNPGKDVAVWCQLRGEGPADWFGQRERVVVAVLRLWRTLKDLGLVDNSPAAFRAALAEDPA